MEVLAGRRELFRSGVLEVPQFVLHSAVEFLRIFLPFQMEFDTNRRVLQIKPGVAQQTGKKRKRKGTYDADRKVIVDNVVRYSCVGDVLSWFW